MRKRVLLLGVSALAWAGSAANAAETGLPTPARKSRSPSPAKKAEAPAPAEAPAIIVTGSRLSADRATVRDSIGATSYGIDKTAIEALPGGSDQGLNQLVLQLPGVVQDGFGQLHVRDDHNGLQYRINGTILPEGLSLFGQALSPRLIDSFALITGAMPAQYGLDTAGVIDITTRSGRVANGGAISL
ncbi:MAG TPA: TonB-dependent receptor, partial [Sphingomonas sp.]|nr:TonB-dependent receptor [Sphingomonas sp.]